MLRGAQEAFGTRVIKWRDAKPKSETRNPKQIPTWKGKTKTECAVFLFGFRICFGFRVSSFGFDLPNISQHRPRYHALDETQRVAGLSLVRAAGR